MSNQEGPQFETMLRWYLAGDAAACASWVIRYHGDTGRKLTKQQCEDYVNWLFNDMEAKVVEFARDAKLNVTEFIKQLQTDLNITIEAQSEVVGEENNDQL